MDEGRAAEDVELNAMGAIAKVLSSLEPNVRQRIVTWASVRFGTEQLPMPKQCMQPAGTSEAQSPTNQGDAFQDMAVLFDEASPTTDEKKALVASYWVQEIRKGNVTSIPLNKQLGQLGHQVSHISRLFNSLMAQKPALVIRVRKAGRTKQARKTYKVTAEGIKVVKAMLTARQASPEE